MVFAIPDSTHEIADAARRAITTAEQRLSLDQRPESLRDVVYEAIRRAIMEKTLPPGERITEAGLAEELNVSKTPVREALLKLRQIRLLEEDGRRGWRVVQPSLEVITHAYGMREALEVFAARWVAEQGRPDDIHKIGKAAERSLAGAEAGSHEEFRTADFAFHRAIARAPGNPLLVEGVENVFALIVTLRERDLPHIHFHVECAHAHVRIADAIARGDAEASGEAARGHVRQVRTYVLESFARRTEPERTP